MRRASKLPGKDTNVKKQNRQNVDTIFFKAFLDQGWGLLSRGDEEEATKVAIRAVRLQESDESKELFVNCIKHWVYFPGAEEIKDLLVRAWRGAWGTPLELVGITRGLLNHDPVVGSAIKQALDFWPKRELLLDFLGEPGLSKIAADPLLLVFLDYNKVVDPEMERFLNSVRFCLLVGETRNDSKIFQDDSSMQFGCALARQCYMNEYVFYLTNDEFDTVQKLKRRVIDALDKGKRIAPSSVLILLAYLGADFMPDNILLRQSMPKFIKNILEEQILDSVAERNLRNSIPTITPVANETSVEVMKQYEENPYPRWHTITPTHPIMIDEEFGKAFPFSNFRKIGKGSNLDILIAGCGTGHHSIKFAKSFPDAKILAIDLSMSSLCYAMNKSQSLGVHNIEYAKADILELKVLEKKFDIVSSSGVLHHLSNPEEGWRILLSLLQPDGCMHVGLYSELARRNLVIAQRWLQDKGFVASLESIREAREKLFIESPINPALNDVSRFNDFYSISGTRDLLFHTSEVRYTIPLIRDFLQKTNQHFLGFSIKNDVLDKFRELFSRKHESDLNVWDQFEMQYPDTFAEMYEFWIQPQKNERAVVS